jgi:glycosyltransferase involved in cell wall biosynthesis
MPKLSIIIPVFNEKQTIEEVVKRVVSSNTLNFEKEIIVIDDGSNDGTSEILENLKEKYNFVLLKHSKNLGKGAAIKTALKYVTGDFVLIQDADLESSPDDYPSLLKEINKNFSIVYGSRYLEPKKRGNFLFYFGSKFLTAFFNLLFKTKLTDINTCYKLFKADIIKNVDLEANGFEFCEEITAKLAKAGYSIKEVPISYTPRSFKEGKKIKIRDGFIALKTIIKYWLK